MSPSSGAAGLTVQHFINRITSPDIDESKIAKLTADGATTVRVQHIHSSLVQSSEPRWVDMLTKLRLFELTNFTKICYIDADTLVAGDLSGVFTDPATAVQSRRIDLEHTLPYGEVELPDTYILAGHIDYGWYEHALPPSPVDQSSDAYMNGGFFVLGPSQILFDYYMSLLEHEGLFDPYMMEQNLLNYAHQRQESMPWQALSSEFNVNFPTEQDLNAGVLSFHEKFWEDDNRRQDRMSKTMWLKQRREMLEYYESAGKEDSP